MDGIATEAESKYTALLGRGPQARELDISPLRCCVCHLGREPGPRIRELPPSLRGVDGQGSKALRRDARDTIGLLVGCGCRCFRANRLVEHPASSDPNEFCRLFSCAGSTLLSKGHRFFRNYLDLRPHASRAHCRGWIPNPRASCLVDGWDQCRYRDPGCRSASADLLLDGASFHYPKRTTQFGRDRANFHPAFPITKAHALLRTYSLAYRPHTVCRVASRALMLSRRSQRGAESLLLHTLIFKIRRTSMPDWDEVPGSWCPSVDSLTVTCAAKARIPRRPLDQTALSLPCFPVLTCFCITDNATAFCRPKYRGGRRG